MDAPALLLDLVDTREGELSDYASALGEVEPGSPEPLELPEPGVIYLRSSHVVAPNRKNVIVLGRTERICLRRYDGSALANAEYLLDLGDRTLHGTTDAQGCTLEFDAAGVEEGLLRIPGHAYRVGFVGELGHEVEVGQALLNMAGFPAGPVDGDAGVRTRDATLNFQRYARIEENGNLDDSTRDRLRQEAKIV